MTCHALLDDRRQYISSLSCCDPTNDPDPTLPLVRTSTQASPKSEMADKPYRFSYDEIINILELCAASTESSSGTSEADSLTAELSREVKGVVAHKLCWTRDYTEEKAQGLLPARKEAREVANKLELAKTQVKAAEKAAKAAREMLEDAERYQERWQECRKDQIHAAKQALGWLKLRLDGIDTTLGKRKELGA